MAQIHHTTDYSLFGFIARNRRVRRSNVECIKESMKVQNLLPYRPILVNSKMQIFDGQHRFHAAKELGEPIYYQVAAEDDFEKALLLNSTQTPWKRDDYVNSHIADGNENYIKCQRFCEAAGITMREYFSWFYPSIHKSKINNVRIGSYKYDESKDSVFIECIEKLRKVHERMKQCVSNSDRIIKSCTSNASLMVLFQLDDFDIKKFITKIGFKSNMIIPKADRNAFFEMYKEVYNWKNANPIE